MAIDNELVCTRHEDTAAAVEDDGGGRVVRYRRHGGGGARHGRRSGSGVDNVTVGLAIAELNDDLVVASLVVGHVLLRRGSARGSKGCSSLPGSVAFCSRRRGYANEGRDFGGRCEALWQAGGRKKAKE